MNLIFSKVVNRKISAAWLGAMVALFAPTLEAGYPVYPPSTAESSGFLVFQDSDNEEMLKACQETSQVCARFYIIPEAYELAVNASNGRKMATQMLYMPLQSKRSRIDLRVHYNLTLRPSFLQEASVRGLLSADLASVMIPSILSRIGGDTASKKIRLDQISISPLPVASVQFIARGLPEGREAKERQQKEVEAQTQEAAPEMSDDQVVEIAKQVSQNVRFTEFYSPIWDGNTHSLGQPFSVVVQGFAWDIEPGLMQMLTAKGGNAVVGSVAAQYRAKSTPFNIKFHCNLKTFQKTVIESSKRWHIYRVRSRRTNIEHFNNEEFNAFKKGLSVEDYCSVTEFKDQTIDQNDAIRTIKDDLWNRLLDRTFKTVQEDIPVETRNGTDHKYTTYESIGEVDQTATFDLNVTSEQIQWFSTDIDFHAGEIHEDQFPQAWTLCNHWERVNSQNRQCESVCEPWLQAYLPGHPKAGLPLGFSVSPNAKVCVAYEEI